MFKVPCTRQEAAEIYMQRRKQRRGYLKYDMYLGGLVGCNDKEFVILSCFISRFRCAFCKYDKDNSCYSGRIVVSCEDAIQETFHLKWNKNLQN